MIRWPLCLLDMDVPVDGADAFVITTAERARDLPLPPVLVHAATLGRSTRTTRTRRRACASTASRSWSRRCAPRATSGSTTCDVYFPYDGFTIITLNWFENAGFCGPGEAGDVHRRQLGRHDDGTAILIDGRIPVNPHGGALSEGGTQGSGHIREAVHQLQGLAGDRQVEGARTGDRHRGRLLLQRARLHVARRVNGAPTHGLRPSPRRPHLPVGAHSVPEALANAVARVPDAEAVVGRYARHTHRELDDRVRRAVAALVAAGVAPGDRIAGCTTNDPELVVAFLATMHLGAVWVGINRALTLPEQRYLLDDAGVSVFVGDRAATSAIAGARHELPELRVVLDAEPGDPASPWAARLAAADPADAPEPDVDPFAPAAIAYTSGTTGQPKGVVHSQHNLLLVGAVAAAHQPFPDVRLGVVLPLTILNLMILGPVSTLQMGACVVCIDRIDPVGLAGWIRDERVNTMSAVPAIIHDLLTHPDVARSDLHTLARPGCGGGATPDSFRRLYEQRFGIRLTTGTA